MNKASGNCDENCTCQNCDGEIEFVTPIPGAFIGEETNLQRIERAKFMAAGITHLESHAEFELVCQLEDWLCDLIADYRRCGEAKNE